jgi:hypothetical protein
VKVKMGARELVELGARRCPPGEILRKGYRREGYRRKDGARVKGGHVPATCIVDRGAPGKTPPARQWAREIPGLRGLAVALGRAEKGFLPGWAADKSAGERRAAVRRNVAKQGCLTISRKLVVIHNLNFRQNPDVAQKAMSDRIWAVDQDWCRLKTKK